MNEINWKNSITRFLTAQTISLFGSSLFLLQITILFIVSLSAFLTPLMVSRTFGREVWRLTAIGVASPFHNAPITVTIQEKVSPGMQGRIFSFVQIATFCALRF